MNFLDFPGKELEFLINLFFISAHFRSVFYCTKNEVFLQRYEILWIWSLLLKKSFIGKLQFLCSVLF